jgi:chemotaxis family two-component system response regulator Rcp1
MSLSMVNPVGQENQGVGQRCIRILLAEDNDGDIFLIRRALDMHIGPYDLLLAKDGEEAMRMLERANEDECNPGPDFAVLDLNLPRRTGIQVLERLRNTPKCARAPVIIFTSSDSPQDKSEAFRLGANQYFKKPTNLAGFMKLGEMVRDILSSPA